MLISMLLWLMLTLMIMQSMMMFFEIVGYGDDKVSHNHIHWQYHCHCRVYKTTSCIHDSDRNCSQKLIISFFIVPFLIITPRMIIKPIYLFCVFCVGSDLCMCFFTCP